MGLGFRESVEHFTHAERAVKERTEPCCNAAIPTSRCDPRLQYRPTSSHAYRRPGALTSAALKTSRQRTSSALTTRASCSQFAPRPHLVVFTFPSSCTPRSCTPARSQASRHLGVLRTLHMMDVFFIGMDTSAGWWGICFASHAGPKTPLHTARWPAIHLPLLSSPGQTASVDYFDRLTVTPRGKRLARGLGIWCS